MRLYWIFIILSGCAGFKPGDDNVKTCPFEKIFSTITETDYNVGIALKKDCSVKIKATWSTYDPDVKIKEKEMSGIWDFQNMQILVKYDRKEVVFNYYKKLEYKVEGLDLDGSVEALVPRKDSDDGVFLKKFRLWSTNGLPQKIKIIDFNKKKTDN